MDKIIGVIGGGPSGSFFSKFITELDISNSFSKILLFEKKELFCAPGKKGCNLCAGVLAKTLIDKLEINGYDIYNNNDIIQKNINGYCLVTTLGKVYFEKPDSNISAVSRSTWNDKTFNINSGFDDFIINKIKNNNKIDIIYSKITGIDKKNNKFILTDDKNNEYEVDVLVNAFGSNSDFYNKLNTLLPELIKPDMLFSRQSEIKADNDFIERNLHNKIHIFSSLKFKNINFFALTPKNSHITLTIIAQKKHTHIDISVFTDIINFLKQNNYIPDNNNSDYICSCEATLPISPIKNYLYDNMLFIGDCSGYTRYLKNGIESTLSTAYYAASCLIYYGSDKKYLKKYFYNKCKKIHYDNFYGKILFYLNDMIINHPYLEAAQLKIITDEYKHKSIFTGKIINILWNIFSGELAYKKILYKALNIKFIFKVIYNVFYLTLKKKLSKNKYYYKDYYITPSKTVIKTIGIIGGGPAGSAAAIKAKLLAGKLGQDIKVYLFETKKFGSNFNQCVGVLSPPITSMLKKELEITLNNNILVREIKGYTLHTNNEQLDLLDRHNHKTFAVRRVEFDKLLLDTAHSHNCEIIESRVNDIEINSNTAHIYSDSGDFSVDVIIGAFGLDDSMQSIFKQRIKNYKAPDVLETIITKIHPKNEVERYISKLNDFIKVFLLKHKYIEFGAITPKNDHLTINIAGKNLTSQHMLEFLNNSLVSQYLPEFDDIKFFKGKFPISPAKNFYGNRFVLVGDAAGLIRPFKGKGINSAILTGSLASEIILKNGCLENNLKFYSLGVETILQDLPYGKILRLFTKISKNSFLLDKIVRNANNDKILYDIIFQVISANKTYCDIIDEFSLMEIIKKICNSIMH